MGILNRYIKLFLFRKKWRKINNENYTVPKNIFPQDIVIVGKYTYGPLNVFSWGEKNEKIQIGNFVSIASGVKFILGGNHNLNTVSTYPFKVMVLNNIKEAWSKGPIVVEDDVWIGMDAMILSGVKIGKGSVISAGSIVSKDVPPYAIVAGNPAKIVKYRFKEDIINELNKLDLNKINNEFIERNKDLLYEDCTEEVIKELLSKL